MKKEKYVLVIGAVVVVLLMISSACAVNVVQENKTKDTIESERNEVKVDQNIRLTRKHLPLLKRSINQLDDTNVEKLLIEIIKEIENKGEANSKEIVDIINRLNLPISEVKRFAIIRTGGLCGGYARCLFWGHFRVGNMYFGIPKIGFTSFVSWNAYKTDKFDVDITIAGEHYNYHHYGDVIGFIGIIACSFDGPLFGVDFSFSIDGIGLLTVIT